jgi:hypothetical protein
MLAGSQPRAHSNQAQTVRLGPTGKPECFIKQHKERADAWPASQTAGLEQLQSACIGTTGIALMAGLIPNPASFCGAQVAVLWFPSPDNDCDLTIGPVAIESLRPFEVASRTLEHTIPL